MLMGEEERNGGFCTYSEDCGCEELLVLAFCAEESKEIRCVDGD